MNETPDLIEPLEDLARFAFESAPVLCAEEHGCRDYHRFWTMMRHLDMDGAPPRGRPFFATALGALRPAGGTIRILIAGSADTGLPAMIHNAARDAGLRPALRLVDRCATTVAQNRRLAELTGIDLTVIQGGIQEVAEGDFDAAVTHNVLRFNTPAERIAMLTAIRDALRPGGQYIALENLRSRVPPREPDLAVQQRQRIEARLREAGHPEASIAEIGAAAEAFAMTGGGRGLNPEAAMRQSLDRAGFDLLHLAECQAAGRHSPRVQPGQEHPHPHAEIVAERPA